MWARSKGTSNILSINDCEVMLIFCFISILITPVCHVSYSFCKPSHLCICWSTKIYTLGLACPNANKFATISWGTQANNYRVNPQVCVVFHPKTLSALLAALDRKSPARWVQEDPREVMMGSKQLLSTSSGFDSQFSDLAEMSAGPPSAKKARNKAPTPRAVNRTPAARLELGSWC